MMSACAHKAIKVIAKHSACIGAIQNAGASGNALSQQKARSEWQLSQTKLSHAAQAV